MDLTNIHEAKTNFSRLVARVARGEEIIIGKAGVPIARLVPYRKSRKKLKKRPMGLAKGKIWMSPDFDDPLPESIMAAFRGDRD